MRFDLSSEDAGLEEPMEAVIVILKARKALYIGFSRWSPWQFKAAYKLENLVAYFNSPQYSMLRRKPERRVISLCKELAIGQIVWSPLAQGVLSGNINPPQRRRGDREGAIKGFHARCVDLLTRGCLKWFTTPAANRRAALGVDFTAGVGLGHEKGLRQFGNRRCNSAGTGLKKKPVSPTLESMTRLATRSTRRLPKYCEPEIC
jgi:hypothetical protein